MLGPGKRCRKRRQGPAQLDLPIYGPRGVIQVIAEVAPVLHLHLLRSLSRALFRKGWGKGFDLSLHVSAPHSSWVRIVGANGDSLACLLACLLACWGHTNTHGLALSILLACLLACLIACYLSLSLSLADLSRKAQVRF